MISNGIPNEKTVLVGNKIEKQKSSLGSKPAAFLLLPQLTIKFLCDGFETE